MADLTWFYFSDINTDFRSVWTSRKSSQRAVEWVPDELSDLKFCVFLMASVWPKMAFLTSTHKNINFSKFWVGPSFPIWCLNHLFWASGDQKLQVWILKLKKILKKFWPFFWDFCCHIHTKNEQFLVNFCQFFEKFFQNFLLENFGVSTFLGQKRARNRYLRSKK